MSCTNEAERIIKLDRSIEEKIKLLCELVREIPYQVLDSYDPSYMVEKGAGSCTPKHIFLAEYLKKIGVPVTFLIVSFHYKNSDIKFPESKQELINSLPLSYHTALQVEIKGKDVLVDVTWDSKLKGFPINDDWDGESDMRLAVNPEEIVETSIDPREYTEPLKAKYTEKEKLIIEQFIDFFNEFTEELRKD
jgi:hypothetical protein